MLLTPKQTAAYETLWKLAEALTPRDLDDLNEENWYCDDGHGMYLSLKSAHGGELAGARRPVRA